MVRAPNASALFAALVTLGSVLAPAAPAAGQDFGMSEFRAGVLAHSADVEGPNSTFGVLELNRIEDINFELLFTSPQIDAFAWIGAPRPHVGATINTNGRESMAYAGLTWTAHLFESPVFVEGSFGAALHNGAHDGAVWPARDLGCSLLFRESLSLGYQVTETASVMLTWEHASNAGLCQFNRGLTNIGVRAGFSF